MQILLAFTLSFSCRNWNEKTKCICNHSWKMTLSFCMFIYIFTTWNRNIVTSQTEKDYMYTLYLYSTGPKIYIQFTFTYILLWCGHYGDVIMGAIASQITSLTIVYSTVYSDADQRKHQSSASLAFVWGIHRGPVNSPHKWPITRKMFPFDDVIMVPVDSRISLYSSRKEMAQGVPLSNVIQIQ